MKLTHALLVAAAAGMAPGCASETPEPTTSAEVRLIRASGGFVELQVRDLPVAARALQAELLVDGDDAFTVEAFQAASGLRLDSVQARMRGTNRALLFVGDTRGVPLPTEGAVARFSLEPVTPGAGSGGRLRLGAVLVVGPDGAAIAVNPGPSIAAR